MEEEGATMLPVVSTSCGVLAKETIRGLRVACGAECPEGCMCSGSAHGLPDQVARYRNLVTSLSFAWVRGVVDVQGCAMYSLASATTSPAIRSRSRPAEAAEEDASGGMASAVWFAGFEASHPALYGWFVMRVCVLTCCFVMFCKCCACFWRTSAARIRQKRPS